MRLGSKIYFGVMVTLVSCLITLLATGFFAEKLQKPKEFLSEPLEYCMEDISIYEDIEEIRQKVAELEGILSKIAKYMEVNFQVDIFEITGYAPLDDEAIEGECYSGDPSITANGEPVIPGLTAAAGSGIPFGTTVYIDGIGPRIVQDRGGAVGNRNLDIVFETKDEAIRFGRQNRTVILVKEDIKEE